MVTTEEVNLQYAAQNIPTVVIGDYYFRQSLPSFPAVLNRAQKSLLTLAVVIVV